MRFPRVSHVSPTRLPRVSHVFPTRLPRVSHVFPTRLPRVSHASPPECSPEICSCVGGLYAYLEEEDTDRTRSLGLPRVQEDLLGRLRSLTRSRGVRLVVLLVSGGPLAVPALMPPAKSAPDALLWTSYFGQSAVRRRAHMHTSARTHKPSALAGAHPHAHAHICMYIMRTRPLASAIVAQPR